MDGFKVIWVKLELANNNGKLRLVTDDCRICLRYKARKRFTRATVGDFDKYIKHHITNIIYIQTAI